MAKFYDCLSGEIVDHDFSTRRKPEPEPTAPANQSMWNWWSNVINPPLVVPVKGHVPDVWEW